MKNVRKFGVALVLAAVAAFAAVWPALAGNGTKTVTLVTDNGNGSYTLTMASSSAVTVGDHFGARIGSTSGGGGLWEVMSKPDGVSVIVSETLTEENGGAFGVPIAGDAWYGTPSSLGFSRIPHLAKAYDAAVRRNAYIDGLLTHGGTGATTAAGARTNLGLVIGTNVQAYDAQLADVAGLSPTANNFIAGDGSNFVLKTPSAARTSLGLVIGTDVQAYDAQLSDVAGLSPTANQVIGGDGSNFVLKTVSGLLDSIGSTRGQVLYRGASGWSVLNPGTSGQVLETRGAGADPVWDTDDGAAGSSHAMLSSTHTDSNSSAGGTERGDVMIVGSVTVTGHPSWDKLPHGVTDSIVSWDGTDTKFRTQTALLDTLGSAAQGQILYRNGTSWVFLNAGTAGQNLQTGGAGANPSWSSTITHVTEANTAGSGAPNVLVASESGTVETNEGATAENYHTLPTAVAGYVFTFVCDDTDGMRITASTGDTIRLGQYVTATAGYIRTTKVGNSITLRSINATEWIATAQEGMWIVDGNQYAFPNGEGTLTYVTTSVAKSATGDGQTFAVPAGQLAATGDYLEIEAVYDASSGATGTVDLNFGGTVISTSTSIIHTTAGAVIHARVVRTGAATQIASGQINQTNGTGSNFMANLVSNPTETLANSITIKTTVSAYSSGTFTFRHLCVKFGRGAP